MRIVVALGGNALLRRGEALTAENQRRNVQVAARALAAIASDNELVISHGNGPQVGLLASQAAAYHEVAPYPLDILGAGTEGMIGYMIEQELGNLVPFERPFATILTMVEVDPDDPAFKNPTKPIGPVYNENEAQRIMKEEGWIMKPEGAGWRRVVPSPKPRRIFEIRPIRWLLEKNTIIICAGGGGIPAVYDQHHNLHGVSVVIDKDRVSAMLAEELEADLLILATDVDGVYIDWGTPHARLIEEITSGKMKKFDFASGSMGPKVEAACLFAGRTGKRAMIGSCEDLTDLAAGTAGTSVIAF